MYLASYKTSDLSLTSWPSLFPFPQIFLPEAGMATVASLTEITATAELQDERKANISRPPSPSYKIESKGVRRSPAPPDPRAGENRLRPVEGK
jgi:hypothetical protein